MMRPLVLRAEAEADIESAYDWYEEQQEGLGARFVKSIEAALDKLERHPERYPVVYKDARRLRVPGFPYALYYIPLTGSVDLIACTHLRRDPEHWRSRVWPR